MEGIETKAVTRDLIIQAASALASVCDGAASQDERGYNGMDSVVAKSILRAPLKTDRQVRALWNILRKYHRQLSGMGFDYAELVPPELPPKGEDDRNAYEKAGLPKPPPKVEGVKFSLVQVSGQSRIAIQFEYKADLVAKVKSLKTRGFDKDGSKCGLKNAWLIEADFAPLSAALKAVDGEPVQLTPEVQAIVDRADAAYAESRAESAEIEIPTKLPPYGYQKAGIKMAVVKNGRLMITDEMGLGKSLQALGFLAVQKKVALPALVICPANLLVNWVQEAKKFTDFKCLVLCAKSSLKAFKREGVDASSVPLPGYDLTIMNYNLLETETQKAWMKMLMKGEQVDYATAELIQCGRQALKKVQEEMAKNPGIEIKNRLWKVLTEINNLGSKARGERSPKHFKTFVNGIHVAEFMATGYQTMICDESHYLIDPLSQRGMAAGELSTKMPYVINMTGTPLVNRPMEMWNQIRMVAPKLFPSRFDFGLKFCAGHQTRFGWDFSGSSNLEELDRILRSTIMIRRTKDQVLKELPEMTRVTIPFLIEDKKDYDQETEGPMERLARTKKERDEWKATLSAMSIPDQKKYLATHAAAAARQASLKTIALEDIEKVKQAAVDVKLDQSIEFILNTQKQQGKVIVFATHHSTIDRVKAALEKESIKVETIDGRVGMAERNPIKTRFQEGDTQVLVCGIRAASEGLTLTASHTVIFIEFDWNPAKHAQAAARVHRIGQKNACNIYYLIALGTIEESLVRMIDAKAEVSAAALGEGDQTLTQDSIMDAILDDMAKVAA